MISGQGFFEQFAAFFSGAARPEFLSALPRLFWVAAQS